MRSRGSIQLDMFSGCRSRPWFEGGAFVSQLAKYRGWTPCVHPAGGTKKNTRSIGNVGMNDMNA
ncbi:hypothetical protein BX600DRAFT_473045 [Xylariales sp. PMI_506]|nr:hypothetical protein BX600DRAFT_473045 [Xylariales sp. PMI_506]